MRRLMLKQHAAHTYCIGQTTCNDQATMCQTHAKSNHVPKENLLRKQCVIYCIASDSSDIQTAGMENYTSVPQVRGLGSVWSLSWHFPLKLLFASLVCVVLAIIVLSNLCCDNFHRRFRGPYWHDRSDLGHNVVFSTDVVVIVLPTEIFVSID